MLDTFKKELIRVGKSNNTIESYIRDIKGFIKWFEQTYDKKFNNEILDIDIREYKNYLLNIKKFKVSSIDRKLNSMKQFNNFLVANGVGKAVKIQLVKKVDNNRIVKTISNIDLKRLRRSFNLENNKRDICIFEILVNTGVRESELINIELDDIHLTEKNGANNYSYLIIRNGKGNKYRELPLNNIVKNSIRDYLIVRPTTSYDKLFVGQRGAITRTTVNKILKEYCIKAGIEEISPHILRHTFCTNLINNGTPITTVSKLAGHSTVDITIQYYINTSMQDKQNAVDCLENL